MSIIVLFDKALCRNNPVTHPDVVGQYVRKRTDSRRALRQRGEPSHRFFTRLFCA
jgi:hypothetical protein